MRILLRHEAERLAAPLPSLILEAERVAHTIYQGVHGRRRAGPGETFWQFRPYAVGDAASQIDWRQSARTNKMYVREREWEASQTLALWSDTSGSMQYRSGSLIPTKIDRAHLLALSLAILTIRGGEKAIWLDNHSVSQIRGRQDLERLDLDPTPSKHDARLQLYELPRRTHAVLFSDFLVAPDELKRMIYHYAKTDAYGAIVHILDPLEATFSLTGRVDLEGLEGEMPLMVQNAGAMKDTYLQRLADHKMMLQQLARGAGWAYIEHLTSDAPFVALNTLYQRMAT